MPTFQEPMLPLLRLAEDGQEHKLRDATTPLARTLGLSEAEVDELLPSGQQSRFLNRLAWARWHLKTAGLMENPARGSFRITDRGRSVLVDAPNSIDMKFLERFP
ncbi:MAG: winged helix-turn-helix domain-containing protein, partial [Gaiellaceae bacterium]